MQIKYILPIGVFFLFFSCATSDKNKSGRITEVVDSVMKGMTLDEKIGQLNLPSSGDMITGETGSSDIAKKIEKGMVGGLFNIKTVAKLKKPAA